MTWTCCKDCGNTFERPDNEAWRVRCTPCYKVFKRAETSAVDSYWPDRAAAAESAVATLKREVSVLQCQLYSERQTVETLIKKQNGKQGGSLDRELAEQLPRLLLVCHPDKHGNSQAATKATQWLLEVRGRLSAY